MIIAVYAITITFETKCYENDWEYLLKAGRLKKMKDACRYPFDRAFLHIDNVNDPDEVERWRPGRCRGVIDVYARVADFADEALAFFGCGPPPSARAITTP